MIPLKSQSLRLGGLFVVVVTVFVVVAVVLFNVVVKGIYQLTQILTVVPTVAESLELEICMIMKGLLSSGSRSSILAALERT